MSYLILCPHHTYRSVVKKPVWKFTWTAGGKRSIFQVRLLLLKINMGDITVSNKTWTLHQQNTKAFIDHLR